MSSDNKKHQPTPQKLKKARADGQVAKSGLFSQLFQMVGMIIGMIIAFFLFWSTPGLVLNYREFWGVQDIASWFSYWSAVTIKTLAICLGFGALGGLIGEVAQVGLVFSWKSVKLDPTKLNPVEGGKRLAKELKKIWLLGIKFFGAVFIASIVISHFGVSLVELWLMPPGELIRYAVRMFSITAGSILGLLVVLGLFERLYKKFEFTKQQMMTDEEIRREYKESEGDPHVRGQRRALQRELAFTEVATRVRKARVIIVERNT